MNHRARTRGKSKYGISRAPRVLLDLITVQFLLRYLAKPMQLFGKWGLLCFAAGFMVLLVLIGEKLAGQAIANRPLLLAGVLATVLGALLFCTGLLGELLTRIYHEVGGRDPYVLRRDTRLVPLDSPVRGAVPASGDWRLGRPQLNAETAT